MDEVKSNITNRKIALAAVILLITFAAGSIWWWYESGRRVSTDDARVKGTMTTVSAKIAGNVERIMVKEGDVVKRGQLIAVIEKREYENGLKQAKANLAIAKAKLDAAVAGNRPQEIAGANAMAAQGRAAYDNALRNYDRDVSLYRDGAISAMQMDAAETALKDARAAFQALEEKYSLTKEGARKEDIALAEAAVEQAEAAVKNAEILLADTDIIAPGDGTVGQKATEVGEFVSAGVPLFNITDLGDVWIGANIEETEIGKISIGNPVDFTIDAYPGVKFHGTVIESGPAAGSQYALMPMENTTGNFTKVTQRLPIKIQPDPSDSTLKPGMSAQITIYVK